MRNLNMLNKKYHLIILLLAFFYIPPLNASIFNEGNLKESNIESKANKYDLRKDIDSKILIDQVYTFRCINFIFYLIPYFMKSIKIIFNIFFFLI